MANLRQQPAVLLAAAAVLSMATGLLGSNATDGPASTGVIAPVLADAPTPGTPTVDNYEPRRPFQEFWAQADTNAGEKLADELVRQLGGFEPEFLIATLPDPIDSRFGYRFDAILDDLQMAIESQQWNFDRFWLPWWPSGTQLTLSGQMKPVYTPTSGKELSLKLSGSTLLSMYDKSISSTPGAETKSTLHEREPGVLLFRKARHHDDPDHRQRLLVVFLVGERPTSGVHKAALGQAFNIVETVSRRSREQSKSPIIVTDFPVLGPYFSGAERSIAAVIQDWVRRRVAQRAIAGLQNNPLLWHFDVMSGGANQIDPKQFVRDSSDDGHLPVTVEFHATLYRFDRVLDTLFKFLKQRNGDWALGKVALLTESDTEFGNKPLAGGGSGEGSLEQKFGAAVTQMKYPFHISQVAIAIDRFRRGDPKAAPALSRSSSKLRIPFDETGAPRDVVPSLTPQTTAASDEFDMAKILETVAIENFRYVGIIASDTRDTIFLSSLIQQFCPDVQVFTATGDLLLGHPDYAGQLRGTVVASPYPLFSMAQRWDPPHKGDRRRHLFMHESDQGYYNAAVTFVGRREWKRPDPWRPEDEIKDRYYNFLYDYGRPFDEMDLAAPELKLQPSHPADFVPPIWVGVVGERGVWPVKYEPIGHAGAEDDSLFVPSKGDTPPNKLDNPGLRAEDVKAYIDNKLIPLIPQFTWTWAVLAIGLSALAWRVFLAHWELATDTAQAGGVSDRFRLMPESGEDQRSPLFGSQEWSVAALLTALAAVYGFIVVQPCRLTIRHSPWGRFLGPSLWQRQPFAWGDYWNWQLGLVVAVLCGAGVTAMVSAVSLRLYRLGGSRSGSTYAYHVITLIVVGLLLVSRSVEVHYDLAVWVCLLIPFFLLAGAAIVLFRRYRQRYEPRLAVISAAVLTFALILGMTIDPPHSEAALGYSTWAVLRGVCVRWVDALILTTAAVVVICLSSHPEARIRGNARPSKRLRWVVLGGIPLAAGILMLGVEVSLSPPTGPYESLLYLERAFSLGNGVTPIIPVLFLGAAAGLWGLSQLRRTGMADRFWRDRYVNQQMNVLELSLDRAPGMEAVARRKERIVRAGQDVRNLLRSPVPGAMWKRPWSLAALGLAAIFLLRMYERFIPTVDGINFSRVMVLAFSFLVFAIVVSLARFLFVWSALQVLLREFALLPMQRAFDRVPTSVSREFGPYLNAIRPRLSNLERHARQWARVASGYRWEDVSKALPCGTPSPHAAHIKNLTQIVLGEDLLVHQQGYHAAVPADRILRAFEAECLDLRTSVELSRSEVRRGIRKATAACLSVLIPHWNARALLEGYGETLRSKDGAPPPPSPGLTADPGERFAAWVQDAEDLIALEFINFVSECTVHLKNLAQFLTVGPLLLLLAASSYPFQPNRFLVNCLWVLLLAVAAGVTRVYIGLERDEVLSRVAKTSPDGISLNWTFVTQITAILIPLVGSFLTRFPFFSDTLNQWLGPIFGVLP